MQIFLFQSPRTTLSLKFHKGGHILCKIDKKDDFWRAGRLSLNRDLTDEWTEIENLCSLKARHANIRIIIKTDI